MSQGGEFSKFIAEFGSSEEEDEKQEQEQEDVPDKTDAEEEKRKMEKMKNAAAGDALMQTEERNTGAISNKVYKIYLKAGKAYIILPFLLLSVVLLQSATVLSSYWFVHCLTVLRASTNERYILSRLVWWQEKLVFHLVLIRNLLTSYLSISKFHQPQGFYVWLIMQPFFPSCILIHCSQMGIYTGFGCSQALFSFFMGTTIALLTFFSSQQLHKVF
jgi:hypothetical protein